MRSNSSVKLKCDFQQFQPRCQTLVPETGKIVGTPSCEDRLVVTWNVEVKRDGLLEWPWLNILQKSVANVTRADQLILLCTEMLKLTSCFEQPHLLILM
jgi:hypothetical protein